ncbi:hypothetical protein GCM10008955_22600 [Deinococcus malanensis]|uniref:Four-helix bundle copper-binding protein n=1 Tax=Deinococcus malanensis TaxID=1706855 RepID=A0ABQ2EYF0_9DEIO|nr:four-helix bundle copper-binding protein [Deinococcus malanensis]GGK28324.1 hypothetical protein GCM10008955_22600 [Deinococcus malanensis]
MKTRIQAMLSAHPQPQALFDQEALAECIAACMECAQACGACADACLGEPEHLAHLLRCIRMNLDCADICAATARILSRLTAPDQNLLRTQLQACVAACKACGDECQRHASEMHMQHCALCAESCQQCEAACAALLGRVTESADHSRAAVQPY